MMYRGLEVRRLDDGRWQLGTLGAVFPNFASLKQWIDMRMLTSGETVIVSAFLSTLTGKRRELPEPVRAKFVVHYDAEVAVVHRGLMRRVPFDAIRPNPKGGAQ